jgi:acyl-CoA synthetase (AMP-forming)/AMP-acid ligase II
MPVKVLEGCRCSRGTGKNHAAKSHGSAKTFTGPVLAAPMSASRLEEALDRIGPVMGQLFGQSEAPMMISTTAPAGHFHTDGSLARERLSSAGRPTPLTVVAIMDDDGKLLGPGQRGEIVVRGPLVAAPGGALPIR